MKSTAWIAPFLALGLQHALAAETTFSVQASRQPNEWTITYNQQKLLVYSFVPTQYKPYVKELCTLDGHNLLRDAPYDHLHHHALMYGIRVNGLNFWEETAGCGVQKPMQSPPPTVGQSAAGRPELRITQQIHWVAPQDAFLPDTFPVALLMEQRTLTLTVDEGRKEVALRWNSKFEVGQKTNEVTLSGANYHGLGLRFLQELDASATHLNSGNVPELSDNKQDVTAGDWGSVSFKVPGRPATIILYGHPSNAGEQARFFTMKTPFAYLSATQELDKNPLIYHKGEKFELNYLIVVYPEIKSAAAIRERAAEWKASIGR